MERKPSFSLIGKFARKTAARTQNAATGLPEPIKELLHAITLNNGKEFAFHGEIANSLDEGIYFAHPYSPWAWGSNENANGLIRKHFPKKRLHIITDAEIAESMHRLSHRPRNKLGFKTQYEVFFKTSTLLTVALQS